MTWPGHREADVALRDGSTAHVRPARAGDAAAVRAFFERLSPQSTALRFFSGFPNLDRAVAWATEVDFERRYSLLATGGDGRVLAHAGWEREPDRPERAEVALVIADAIQGKDWARSCSASWPRRPTRPACRCSRPRSWPTTTR
jgi:acetate---CoA ligase (ADP-forming)